MDRKPTIDIDMPEHDVATKIRHITHWGKLPNYLNSELAEALQILTKTTFSGRMTRMLEMLTALIKEDKQEGKESDHHELCTIMANAFGLWETDPDSHRDLFPVWLSRVVEGEIRDINPNPNSRAQHVHGLRSIR